MHQNDSSVSTQHKLFRFSSIGKCFNRVHNCFNCWHHKNPDEDTFEQSSYPKILQTQRQTTREFIVQKYPASPTEKEIIRIKEELEALCTPDCGFKENPEFAKEVILEILSAFQEIKNFSNKKSYHSLKKERQATSTAPSLFDAAVSHFSSYSPRISSELSNHIPSVKKAFEAYIHIEKLIHEQEESLFIIQNRKLLFKCLLIRNILMNTDEFPSSFQEEEKGFIEELVKLLDYNFLENNSDIISIYQTQDFLSKIGKEKKLHSTQQHEQKERQQRKDIENAVKNGIDDFILANKEEVIIQGLKDKRNALIKHFQAYVYACSNLTKNQEKTIGLLNSDSMITGHYATIRLFTEKSLTAFLYHPRYTLNDLCNTDYFESKKNLIESSWTIYQALAHQFSKPNYYIQTEEDRLTIWHILHTALVGRIDNFHNYNMLPNVVAYLYNNNITREYGRDIFKRIQHVFYLHDIRTNPLLTEVIYRDATLALMIEMHQKVYRINPDNPEIFQQYKRCVDDALCNPNDEDFVRNNLMQYYEQFYQQHESLITVFEDLFSSIPFISIGEKITLDEYLTL
jgi:hypothetical protein